MLFILFRILRLAIFSFFPVELLPLFLALLVAVAVRLGAAGRPVERKKREHRAPAAEDQRIELLQLALGPVAVPREAEIDKGHRPARLQFFERLKVSPHFHARHFAQRRVDRFRAERIGPQGRVGGINLTRLVAQHEKAHEAGEEAEGEQCAECNEKFFRHALGMTNE